MSNLAKHDRNDIATSKAELRKPQAGDVRTRSNDVIRITPAQRGPSRFDFLVYEVKKIAPIVVEALLQPLKDHWREIIVGLVGAGAFGTGLWVFLDHLSGDMLLGVITGIVVLLLMLPAALLLSAVASNAGGTPTPQRQEPSRLTPAQETKVDALIERVHEIDNNKIASLISAHEVAEVAEAKRATDALEIVRDAGIVAYSHSPARLAATRDTGIAPATPKPQRNIRHVGTPEPRDGGWDSTL